mmetsp:Transcript_118630/g.369576  ORF Transcript_118630/g.369576 Transcript_118630/m.369576 type:complete len:367 (-) Transcript_118630:54-1154(-)|eukprot:CAMPEP_0204560490 /NCGR_PEP_ID=MMETSP0661-20131031/32649_1 /ASSEMBLY_ACC=CAM_ASM_000606 /TAXON_ID=109239 /ORGANISM="Alexandrium margalefi, Strain AMGDE01CS-322" /LENGTH=366 /DNA_ID=CAMNT_0051567831 /DNA_START=78 /DNA_END=1178 /DNA_ORIENTATION=+
MPVPTEKRTDPADGRAYTFAEVSAAYRRQYGPGQIRHYWDNDMRLAESSDARAGAGEEESRIDPSDGRAYTFSGVAAKYAGQYSNSELSQYWRGSMKPAGSSGSPAVSSTALPRDAAVVAGAGGTERLRVSFCLDPKTIGQKFTLTYDEDPAANFASVNPGDQGLRVGGATLNGQFQKDLYNFGWQETEKYGPYHNKLFAVAPAQKFTRAPPDILSINPNLMAGFVLKASDGGKVGTAFIDIFRNEVRVHKNQRNLAMVYTVGPRRQDCPSDQAFLALAEAAARGVCLACTEYNSLAEVEGLPRIEVLRVPLVSGGAFAGRCPKDAVAAALLRGLLAGHGADTPQMNFAFDGDIFQLAWKGIKAEA